MPSRAFRSRSQAAWRSACSPRFARSGSRPACSRACRQRCRFWSCSRSCSCSPKRYLVGRTFALAAATPDLARARIASSRRSSGARRLPLPGAGVRRDSPDRLDDVCCDEHRLHVAEPARAHLWTGLAGTDLVHRDRRVRVLAPHDREWNAVVYGAVPGRPGRRTRWRAPGDPGDPPDRPLPGLGDVRLRNSAPVHVLHAELHVRVQRGRAGDADAVDREQPGRQAVLLPGSRPCHLHSVVHDLAEPLATRPPAPRRRRVARPRSRRRGPL